MGYGTGLLSYVNFLDHLKTQIKIDYTSIEAYPLSLKELGRLNYNRFFEEKKSFSFTEFSELTWEVAHQLSPIFTLQKQKSFFEEYKSKNLFDIIYYDAFGAHAQPDLWEIEWMEKCFDLLNYGGVWVSFCAKGSVRRALQEVGFKVERLPGPPGKREMLRAVKP